MKKIRRTAYIVLWLLLWELLSVLVGNEVLLVGPWRAVLSLLHMLKDRLFYQSVLFSGLRILSGFLLGALSGLLLSALSYRKRWLRELLGPAVTALRAIPVASFVILLLVWAGSRRLSFCISALISFPILYVNALNGFLSTDEKLVEMAELFRMPEKNRLRYLYLPALYPHLCSALQLALGMSWKSGVAAELIAQPPASIGNGLYLGKIYLETDTVLAWTLIIILLSFGTERLLLLALGRLDPKRKRGAKRTTGNDARRERRGTQREGGRADDDLHGAYL